MRILIGGALMAKQLFHTTEKSDFILNMDLDKYRSFCAKMVLIVLWVTAASAALYQITYPVNSRLAEMAGEGGFAAVFSLLLIALRSTASLFSVVGVAALITMVIGLMRKQFTKQTAVPYLLLAASLGWAVVSMCHSYSTEYSLFGQDGRDEGLLSLLMYAAVFYLGTMLRRRENLCILLRGTLIFGIVQGVWGLLQAQPFFAFPTEYADIEPMLLRGIRLPSGLTDSPVTYAMLLCMLLAVSVPAALCAEKQSTRILGAVSAVLSLLMTVKTQTYAGLIAAGGALLVTAGFVIGKRKELPVKRLIAVPCMVLAALACSVCWTYFTPSLNGVTRTLNEETVEDGITMLDGAIVWDDANYRLSAAGPYQRESAEKLGFEVSDAASVLRYCRSEGIRVIKMYPVLGTGPDNFAFTQLHKSMVLEYNTNSIDRPYNDLLFIGATRGILSMVLHIALLIVSIWFAWKNRKAGYGWLLPAFGAAALLYVIASNVGISVLTVAPLFWGMLGVLAGEPIIEAQKQEKTRQPKKKKAKAAE